MSRRKQTKPRQIKRSLGDLEEGDDHPPDEPSQSEDEGGASDQEDSAESDSSPLNNQQMQGEGPNTPDTNGAPASPGRDEDEKSPLDSGQEEEEETEQIWEGPDELHLSSVGGVKRVLARKDLSPDTTWGPYRGWSQSRPQREGEEEEVRASGLIGADAELWLNKLPVTSNNSEANCTIYNQGEELYCKLTQAVRAGDRLLARLHEHTTTQTHNAPVKEEEGEASHLQIHLLPQQAGMAAVLATAVINKDVFPCQACGIWYRSKRNLQAHLQYYCASRNQGSVSPSLPEPPSEYVCPLAHCSKSFPSASSLEVHTRTHSGERPFVCLICLSAFTTKANCARHLRIHSDPPDSSCPACGFVSSSQDVLHSHLVTCRMACQSESHSQASSPGPAPPPLQLSTGESEDCGVVLKCQVCGFPVDTPALLHQHVQTHLKIQSPAPQRSSCSSVSPEPMSVAPTDPAPPSANGCLATPQGVNLPCNPPSLSVKEEPHSDVEDEAPPSESPSPGIQPLAQVKAEPTSGASSPRLQGGAGAPQQSCEILAKMTEMVHTRLRQGHTPTSPADRTPTRPVHKGATCFECDITFNNVNNFYVHKKLYCSSRHQHKDPLTATPPAACQGKERAESVQISSSPGPLSVQQASKEIQTGGAAVEGKPAEIKTERTGLKEASCSEGESGGRASEASEGSQSPGGSGEDADDPNATFCQACSIRFSRRESYAVHKRFYCAWRHQPGSPRPPAANAGCPPQPFRTRKRKKMYEIHMARSLALANSSSAPNSAPPPEFNSAPSPCSEGDLPIDLRKRSRPHETGRGPPTPPVLSDYHKCSACSISFNSLENYLAHKSYYCPVPLQRRPLQPLGKMCPIPSLRSGLTDQLDPPPVRPGSPSHSPPLLGSKEAAPAFTLPTGSSLACPYCPQGGAIVGDLVDHLRTVHGLVLTRLPGAHPGSPSPGRRELSEAPPPQTSPGTKPHQDAVNGSSSHSPPQMNGSPLPAMPTSPQRAGPQAVSPVPVVKKEVEPDLLQTTPPLMSPKAAQVSPLQNGTSRYCRLCNIRFSSLSTFIAHKKYYCSSHSAEHVK
ncbi:hypothetical protein GJAV_G00228500 [Gymnothorax javanicus]|nr:hypothetical protein GJAV_G00228500 [Gymnothorax javanicus]